MLNHRRFALLGTIVVCVILLLALALLRAEIAPSAYASDPGAGEILIVAWRDDNGNGIMDPGEPRVAAVTIAVRRAESGQITQCVTGEAGECHISDLAPGSYYLSPQPPLGTSPPSIRKS